MKSDFSETPVANRTRISLFGRRNAGKSSLINALTGQSKAIVADVPGTTTDPVSKTMEILPLGPCVVTDTAGLDDEGELGAERVKRSLAVLETTDIALVVVPCNEEPGETERRVVARCAEMKIPVILVRTKSDLAPQSPTTNPQSPTTNHQPPITNCSAKTGAGIDELRAKLAAAVPDDRPGPLVADLVTRGDIVICVCPIDAAAPKGRLILPQQQVIRELIENGCTAAVCQPSELKALIERIGKGNVKFVITDSQAFAAVDAATPPDVPLTSFSIVFARQKGDLKTLCAGAEALKGLKDGDTVLIAEGCTHRRQCGDIGTVKLPAWIRKFTGKNLAFKFSSGGDFPLDGDSLPSLVVHCGGCMLTRRAVMSRIGRCLSAGVPVVNYGVAIALMHGIVAHPGTCMVVRSH